MKRFFFVIAACITALTVQAQAQTIAPDFTKTDINGKTHNLYKELAQGKAVLLDFFRVHCHACQGTVPYIEKLAKDYKGKLTVWKLDVNKETKAQIDNFKKKYGSTVTTFNDCRADFLHYQQLESITFSATPTFVLIRPDRTVVRGWVGYRDAQVRAAIDAISSATDVPEVELPVSSFNLFPSPATQTATAQFSLKTPTYLTVELFDASGSKLNTVFEGNVAAHDMQTVTIPTESLSNGTYFLRFRGAGLFFTRTLTVVQ